MTRGRARRYLLMQSDQVYYPQIVADAGYDVWDWSTLNAGTLFQDSAKTTPAVANADPVGCWVDRVKLTDATQATTAVKPGLALDSLNGLATLSFDGGDVLATGNISISTFAVWVVTTNVTTKGMTFEHSINAFSNDGMSWQNNDFRVTRSSSTAISNLTYVTPSVFRGEFNGAPRQYLNNTLTGTLGATIPTASATAPLFIGARNGVVLTMTGNIAHLCIVSPYPTAEIIASMESYINGLWSVY